MIKSTEIRQRKSTVTTPVTIVEDKEDVKKSLRQQKKDSGISDNVMSTLLFLLSLPIRFKNITLPSQVVFDEIHFGKFASYYIKRTFFFDVHPPLAKLLITLIAWISGFKGDFDFTEIGDEYPSSVPLLQMRGLGALFGALIIPLAYLTIRDAGHSRIAATLTSLAICFENGLITNNRLILLDSYLLFFTVFTVFSWTRFYNKTRPFSPNWWLWLTCTGIGLGCTVSSKWAGLFTVATIGLSTVKQLWEILGDLKVTKRQFAGHFFARTCSLIILPVIMYIGFFYIHFAILDRSGPGESYMDRETQNELKGYYPIDTPLPITYGSLITMRQLETTGGFLHSHKANYPEGSQQQQVTLYPHIDDNNWWRVLKADIFKEPINDVLANDNSTWLEYVRNGDIIRLEHVLTAPHKLHSHDIPAPVTDTTYHREVSAYGFPGHVGDSNDHWRVQLDENNNYPEAGHLLQSRRSKFRLHHDNEDCDLFSSFERLPDWGFEQQEVSCIVEGLKPKTMWMIDETRNEMFPDNITMEPEHRQNFLQKFRRLHKMMWVINNELTENHPFESRPSDWPTLFAYIAFWQSEQTQVILLGSPLVYWSSTLSVVSFIMLWSFFKLREKRGYKDSFGGLRAYYENTAGFFVMGWLLHYVPFFRMERQLFLHHYMPALYFAILTMGVATDIVLRRFPRILKLVILAIASACIIYTYLIYSPITYGEPWSVAQCEKATLLERWQLSCARYAPLGSPERDELMDRKAETVATSSIIYVDEDGKRISANDVLLPVANDISEEEEDEEEGEHEIIFPPANKVIDHDIEEYGEDDDDYDEDDFEEDDAPAPTEAPIIEREPEFVDGKEVYGEDDEDEDEWPKTVYGTDPEANEDDEEDPKPLTTRSIPSTRHVEF